MSKTHIMHPFVDQSINDLHYCLFTGKANPHVLKVIKQMRISTEFCTLEAAIIGESHYLTFSCGTEIITELMACIDFSPDTLLGAKGTAIIQHPFAFKFDDHRYAFQAKIIDLQEISSAPLEAFELFYNRCALQDRALEHRFEMPCSSMFEAKTSIAMDIPTPDTLDIQTLHLYPNESRGILTFTRFHKVAQ
ncbi:DUF2617 family protein [Sulfuricurvum sp.]|uniref:DUF2617 family protein n=1 Tax=Sulfuricurvum sp. TaxID=2025608 RepID=UPI0034142315